MSNCGSCLATSSGKRISTGSRNGQACAGHADFLDVVFPRLHQRHESFERKARPFVSRPLVNEEIRSLRRHRVITDVELVKKFGNRVEDEIDVPLRQGLGIELLEVAEF
jgi:hypothetical protein